MRAHLLWIVALELTLTSCARNARNKVIIDGIEVYEAHWAKAKEDIARRATFEFSCPESRLEFTLLHREGQSPTEVVVKGCGRRALYERPIVRLGGIGGAYGGAYSGVGEWRLVSTGADDRAAPHLEGQEQTQTPPGAIDGGRDNAQP